MKNKKQLYYRNIRYTAIANYTVSYTIAFGTPISKLLQPRDNLDISKSYCQFAKTLKDPFILEKHI